MHIIITGANGFIGQALTSALLDPANPIFSSSPLSRLTLIDLDFNNDNIENNPLVNVIKGSFAEIKLIEEAIAEQKADMVFHLASAPSGLTESNHSLGMQVNVLGMINLLNLLHEQGNKPKVIFASSIATYGKPEAAIVDEETLPGPGLSYGFQKLIGENLISDYSHKGWIDGCSLRLPGIVTRPPEPNGAISIFFSDLIRELSKGNTYTCPVSANARSWLISVKCCVDNLVTAAQINFTKRRTWTLPALHVSIAELVQAIGVVSQNKEINNLISYEPDAWVEENFGSYPPLSCPKAEALGLRHDTDVESMVRDSF